MVTNIACSHVHNPRWHLTLSFLVQIGLLLMDNTHASTPSTNNAFNQIKPLTKMSMRGGALFNATDTLEKDRLFHVRHILNERLHYNQAGLRDRDFAKWIKTRGDDAVISMHGLEEDVNHTTGLPAEFTSNTESTEVIPSPQDGQGLYAGDMLDLDLIPVPSLPSLHKGKPLHLIDDTPPSFSSLCFRSIKLGFHFTPILSTALIAYISPRFREEIWYKWVATCLASSGPAFIKWGQWASTREDMFPEKLCVALSQLHNEAPSHSWQFTRRMVESSLGLPEGGLLGVFESFDTAPLASGSIAQVHKAVLRADYIDIEDGTVVAVKVRHPNVARLIDMDFRLMSTAAKMADALPALSWLNIRDSVEQFSHTMAAQAHLNVEAHHLEVLNHNFRSWAHVKFPEPIYASSSVIIETFEPGRIITGLFDHYDAIASKSGDGEQGTLTVEEVMEDDDNGMDGVTEGSGYQLIPLNLAKFIVVNGLSIYLKMLLEDNLMHADLHPGNLMIDTHANFHRRPSQMSSSRALASSRTSSTASKQLPENFRICIVDAGMVAKLTDTEAVNFIGLLSSLGEGDGVSAAQFALRFSRDGTDLTEEQKDAFTTDMVTLFGEKCRGYGHQVDVGEVLRGVLGLVRKYRIRIDANYATLVVNALCIESLARRVCPNYNVLDSAQPLLRNFRKMCIDRDGNPRDEVARRSGNFMKLWLSILYWKKNQKDSKFFRDQKLLMGAS